MDHFPQENLRRLAECKAEPAVSVYMPTIRAGRETRQNALRAKNLVTKLEEQLKGLNLESARIQKLVEPIRELRDDDDFWQHQSDGLAVFISARLAENYRVPLNFDERLVIGRRFYLKPLVRLLEGDGSYFLLAVSQNQVRFFQGSHYSIAELHPEQLPTDLRSALNIDEYKRTLQHHSEGTAVSAELQHGLGPRGTTAGQTTMFHGQGGSGMENKKRDELKQFFHMLDEALRQFLHGDRIPLLFAGVEYLFPIFAECCKYKGLVKSPLEGNPDGLSADALHDKAWKRIHPLFQRSRQEALDSFGDRLARDLATADLQSIIAASRHGQVDTLLMGEGQAVWGELDEETGEIRKQEGQTPQAHDLVNDAVVHTILNGGAVYTVVPEQMPEGAPAAALLRYPLSSPV